MPVRNLRLAVAALVALATMAPVYAEGEPEGLGANVGYAGFVVSNDSYTFDDSGNSFTIAGDCDFSGVILPIGQDGGGQIVQFSGSVSAAGPAVPIVADVNCEIRNAFGFLHSQDLRLNGNTAVVGGSTLSDESQFWPLQPITICVSGSVVFGPSPTRIVTLTKRCKTPS